MSSRQCQLLLLAYGDGPYSQYPVHSDEV